jgi:hypothetical protein
MPTWPAPDSVIGGVYKVLGEIVRGARASRYGHRRSRGRFRHPRARRVGDAQLLLARGWRPKAEGPNRIAVAQRIFTDSRRSIASRDLIRDCLPPRGHAQLGSHFAFSSAMRSPLRCLALSALGLLSVACFNSSKTTKVEPGAANLQPAQCLALGAICHSSADCCTQSCADNTCVAKK